MQENEEVILELPVEPFVGLPKNAKYVGPCKYKASGLRSYISGPCFELIMAHVVTLSDGVLTPATMSSRSQCRQAMCLVLGLALLSGSYCMASIKMDTKLPAVPLGWGAASHWQ